MDDQHVTHTQIFERIEAAERAITTSENRTMALIKWLAGGFGAVGLAAVSWGVTERMEQINSNAKSAQAYGETIARQDEIQRHLKQLGELIRSESELTREKITSHTADPTAHKRGN